MKLWKQSLRIIKTRCDERSKRSLHERRRWCGLSMMSASTKKCKKRNTPWSLCVLPFLLLSASSSLSHPRARDSIESDFMLVAGNIKSHLSTFYVDRLIISDNWLWLLPSTSHPFPPFHSLRYRHFIFASLSTSLCSQRRPLESPLWAANASIRGP